MSKRRGPGRPKLPKGEARDAVLSVRLTKDEKRAMEREAADAGETLGDWCRSVLLRSVRHGG